MTPQLHAKEKSQTNEQTDKQTTGQRVFHTTSFHRGTKTQVKQVYEYLSMTNNEGDLLF